VGKSGVGAFTVHGDLKIVRSGHYGSGTGGYGAGFQPGAVVHAVGSLDPELLYYPLLDHEPPAAAALLGGLEDEYNGSVKVPTFRKIASSAQQHGYVPVMTAGVHHTVVDGTIHKIRAFLYREGVHVGPQSDGSA